MLDFCDAADRLYSEVLPADSVSVGVPLDGGEEEEGEGLGGDKQGGKPSAPPVDFAASDDAESRTEDKRSAARERMRGDSDSPGTVILCLVWLLSLIGDTCL